MASRLRARQRLYGSRPTRPMSIRQVRRLIEHRSLDGGYVLAGSRRSTSSSPGVVGGYLAATLVGRVRGAASTSRRLSIERIGAFVGYAIPSGIGVALLARAAYGVGGGHLVELSTVGAFVVLAAAAAASGLQALLGLVGMAIVLVVFVALGNPSAGGAVSYHLLPAFFRGIGPFIVNGAGVDLTRNVLDFGAHDLTRPIVVLAVWTLAGIALTTFIGGRVGLGVIPTPMGTAGAAGSQPAVGS